MKKSYCTLRDRSAKNYVFWLLSKRDYTKAALKLKLEKKCFKSKQIAETLKKLEELKFIDDKKFANDYSFARLRTKPRAKKLLMREMSAKGVPKEIIDDIVPNIYEGKKEENLLSCIVKKEIKKSKKIDRAGKNKLIRKLLRLGFEGEGIIKAIEKYENS